MASMWNGMNESIWTYTWGMCNRLRAAMIAPSLGGGMDVALIAIC